MENNTSVRSLTRQSDLPLTSRSEIEILVMEATAYTMSSEEGTADGITATGTKVHRGVVAVDPQVIPLGTRLWIEGYGEAVALDTGGAIRGKHIDLYMDTEEEALRWGRRKVRVKILETGRR